MPSSQAPLDGATQSQKPGAEQKHITTYLQSGGKLEVAQQMASHESARTTGLYDRRSDAVALDEVDKVVY